MSEMESDSLFNNEIFVFIRPGVHHIMHFH